MFDCIKETRPEELERLAALQSYEILDTPPEVAFNDLARLAASIAGAPTALISLVDGTRQWFKARVGLSLCETPRSMSFCAHAIAGQGLFEIPDALQDERFVNNPLVTGDPKIRFYAGAPLVTLDGHALGTLCIIDYIPRQLAPEQREALVSLSQHVMAQLELRRRLAHFTQSNPARRRVITDIRQALDAGQFELHYQPTINVQTGHISSLEALIRWRSPERGLIGPAQFLPILEDSGLIIEVGNWVMHQAAREYREWLGRGLTAPRIALNISPLQMQHPDFVAQLTQVLEPDCHGRVPLGIEITEGLLLQNPAMILAKLREIHGLGVSIALDDFGTGYSSLRSLAHLPVDTLKIDRSFVASMTENPNDMGFVSSMISLAQGLNLGVVAEGVETEEQRKLLRLLGCDSMQGFLFSMPLPKDQIEQLLRREQAGMASERDAVLAEHCASPAS